MTNPSKIETTIQFASMRQIHSAIEHLNRGDFECAITLAAAGEGMLPNSDKPFFFQKVKNISKKMGTQPDGVSGANDFINWLKHGEIKDTQTGKYCRYENATISEFEVILTIYRGISKFEATFEGCQTPQMLSFKDWAGRYLKAQE